MKNIYKKINHLTPIKFCRTDKRFKQIWLFECDCSSKTKKEILLYNVKSGHTKSCGCKKRQILISKNKASSTHNLTKHPLYNIWTNLKNRCYNIKHKSYKSYGGRNIIVGDEWKNNFLAFYNWSIENSYKKRLSIERLDNNFGYFMSNCIWATRTQQANNTRKNKYYEYLGENLTLSQWSKKLDIPRSTLKSRLNIGWSLEKVLSTPIKYKV